ncbi:MAG TPA: TonB family protein [Terracidiphilus sp.]|nr:TonB family protein [Terracidiphilus sp.]
MRRLWLFAVAALAVTCASGQQANAREKGASGSAANVKLPAAGAGAAAAAAAGKSALAPGTVKVYEPRKPVVEPRLLPWAESPELPKDCTDTSEGDSELSLLVDTEGRPRNVMFLKPSGTIADRFAITIVNRDRFAPGTLNGTPVVVAESLEIKMEACIGLSKNAAGQLERGWLLKTLPRQKLKKPKNPPQVAELAPLNAPDAVKVRTVKRPDFFGNGESAPVLIYSEYADYTPSRAGTKGTCEVSLVVDAHGLPQDLHVLKKLDPGLDMSALEAVEKYRFFPAIKGDKPVPAAVVVSVDFAPPQQ